MKKELMTRYNNTGMDEFSDLFMIMAKNVEDSLIQGGATPGEDYSILDLYRLAQPFALSVFKSSESMQFTLSWQSDEGGLS